MHLTLPRRSVRGREFIFRIVTSFYHLIIALQTSKGFLILFTNVIIDKRKLTFPIKRGTPHVSLQWTILEF